MKKIRLIIVEVIALLVLIGGLFLCGFEMKDSRRKEEKESKVVDMIAVPDHRKIDLSRPQSIQNDVQDCVNNNKNERILAYAFVY